MQMRRALVAAIVALSSLSLSSCVGSGQIDHREGLTPLGDAELLRVFQNVRTTHALIIGAETFKGEGEYALEQRTLTPGRFWISGGELCVVVGDAPWCRRFARSIDGEIYQIYGRRAEGEGPTEPPLLYTFQRIE